MQGTVSSVACHSRYVKLHMSAKMGRNMQGTSCKVARWNGNRQYAQGGNCRWHCLNVLWPKIDSMPDAGGS